MPPRPTRPYRSGRLIDPAGRVVLEGVSRQTRAAVVRAMAVAGTPLLLDQRPNLLSPEGRAALDDLRRRGVLDVVRCLTCPGCRCPNGVPVWKFGVRALLRDET